MRLAYSFVGLALLAGFSAGSQADVFICAKQSGEFTPESQACVEPDQSAAYAALTKRQFAWYHAQVECVNQDYDDGVIGDPHLKLLVDTVVAPKKLPAYYEEQFSAAAAKREADLKPNLPCELDALENADSTANGSAKLLSYLSLQPLHTPTGQRMHWMNWTPAVVEDPWQLLVSEGNYAYFNDYTGAMHAVDLNTGHAVWSLPPGRREVVAEAGRVFILDTDEKRIQVLDQSSGKPLNRFTRAAEISGLRVAGDLLIFLENDEALVAIDSHTGVERWRVAAPDSFPSTLQPYQQMLLLINGENVLQSYDLSTGAKRWQQQLEEEDALSVGAAIYLNKRGTHTLQTLAAQSGKASSSYHYGEEDAFGFDADAQMAYTHRYTRDQLQAIDLRTGKVLWEKNAFDSEYDFNVENGRVSGALLLIPSNFGTAIRLIDNKTGALLDTLHTPPRIGPAAISNSQLTLFGGRDSLLVVQKQGL